MRAVERVEPLDVGMPLAQPCSATRARNIEIRIFVNAQRQIRLPIEALEMKVPFSVFRKITDRQVTKAQLAVCIVPRKYQRLAVRVVTNPDHVFVDVLVID